MMALPDENGAAMPAPKTALPAKTNFRARQKLYGGLPACSGVDVASNICVVSSSFADINARAFPSRCSDGDDIDNPEPLSLRDDCGSRS